MLFISFEGSEGCGKSTQVGLLADRLARERGRPPLVLREPGGTPIGEVIRDLLQHAEINAAMTPETELLLFAASRSQLVRETIEPARRRGEIVICDRFFDSTTVYQGAGRALDRGFVAALNEFAVGGCRPDLTFLLEIDAQTAASRLAERKDRKRDRMEEQPASFYDRVREGYRELARKETGRIIALDGGAPRAEIAEKIWHVVESRLSK